MENAIAAVLTGTISQRGAAKRFGVKQQTLSDRLKKASGDVTESGHHTTQESKPGRTKPTDEERQEWWRLHTEEELTPYAIHKITGRNRETINKEIKRRKEAENQPEPTPTPAPTPSIPNAGSSAAKPKPTTQWADDPCLEGWNGALNDLAQKIYKREKSAGKKRIDMATQLAEVKCALEKTMKAASADHRVKAGKLLETDVKIVEAKLQKENQPGITDTLKALIHEAERIQKFASETLRLLQLQSI